MSRSITIRFPDDIDKNLRHFAKMESRKVSDLVRDSVRKTMLLKKLDELREKSIPYAEKIGIYTDEDVFEKMK